MLVSRSASQIVDCIPYQLTGVRKDDKIDSIRQAIFLFFAKSRKQGGCSHANCLTLSFLKKNLVKALALLIPSRSIVIPTTEWYDIYVAANMILQKSWFASSTQLESGNSDS